MLRLTPIQRAADGLGTALWQVTVAWQQAMRAVLEPHNLTHAQFVLLTSVQWLSEHEQPPTPQRIAEHAGIDAAVIGQVLRRLAARQLVNRELDDQDPKARLIVLTDSGRSVLADALSDVETTDQEFFAALGTDAPAFARGLTALRDSVNHAG
ncbi:MAG TPA: MarR family transcriptional regulator [Pseudonocardiaceae bacterium]|jgi:DNA-binding MarR family transcriptional regulator|nr:MarR family transcriptional regulator [Pseudonocardiaceae bacterium]